VAAIRRQAVRHQPVGAISGFPEQAEEPGRGGLAFAELDAGEVIGAYVPSFRLSCN
jgi:hypothetical protein